MSFAFLQSNVKTENALMNMFTSTLEGQVDREAVGRGSSNTPSRTLPHKLALGRAQARPGWREEK